MKRKKACFPNEELRRGAWTDQEDKLLSDYIAVHGLGRWRGLPAKAGLNRCGKSCRLRWLNYLRPGIKRGNITEEEEELIIRLHKLLGNRWSLIAGRIPGRTDNEIKNYWNTYLKRKIAADVSERQSSSKTISTTTTMQSAPENPSSEKVKKKKKQNLVTSMIKFNPIESAKDSSIDQIEDLNTDSSVSPDVYLITMPLCFGSPLQFDGNQEVCPPAAAPLDFSVELDFTFGELSSTPLFSGYGWRDVCSSNWLKGTEEMNPFIAEIEWESLIMSCETI